MIVNIDKAYFTSTDQISNSTEILFPYEFKHIGISYMYVLAALSLGEKGVKTVHGFKIWDFSHKCVNSTVEIFMIGSEKVLKIMLHKNTNN